MFQLATVACLILSLCEYGVCEQVYIIPSPDSPCAAQWLPCYTLTQYINCTTCQSSNVALIFMPGNHTLGTEFSITNKSCLSMSAYYYYRNTSSYTVTCTSSSWMNLSMVGNVMISGLSFINCGGNTARYVDNFILKNSSFTMDPQRHSGYMYSGRAWSVIGSETLSIDSCAFVNNAAGFRGGALYISTVTNAIITVCTFNNNTAAGGRGQGGVVYINNAMNTIINGSTFFNNTMRGGLAQGGALYIDAMYSVINGTMFINNTVRGGLAKGGALYLDAVYSIINGTMFLNNTARGGLAAGGALYVNVMNSVINGTTFEHNMAQGGGAEGGALYIRARNSIIAMSTFINNRATHGVPQYIVASTSVISNDATYEGMQLYDLSSNMTLNEGICGEDIT